jgi:hypothetical protein
MTGKKIDSIETASTKTEAGASLELRVIYARRTGSLTRVLASYTLGPGSIGQVLLTDN